ncbi:metallophosphoesterase [Campylobacter sp. JMF_08 NE1]|uniref:metallophosphoesterase n=1 Tax=Campylobacter sp. JMF_08 NE1 TaxID=2983821 RepID=UPI0022E9F19F|nr:metallophosphoesterase [Campylobacter sp. JMF_08 NE1]MDA3048444.1 metallophosphoesterase [Campylobacter sp. JMF_08 NE1]
MQNIYIIGDVHGCYESLMALIARLPAKFDSKICFVGDLCDRGPQSAKVIEFVRSHGYDCVRGNHERRFLLAKSSAQRCVRDREIVIGASDDINWIAKSGGSDTMKSYFAPEFSALLGEHLEYLQSLPVFLQYDIFDENSRSLVVSHSAVGNMWKFRDFVAVKDDFEAHVLSGRDDYTDNAGIFNVYGHTPQDEPFINDYSANIDLGCVFKKRGYKNARLCAMEFPSKRLFIQDCIDF